MIGFNNKINEACNPLNKLKNPSLLIISMSYKIKKCE